MRWNFLRVYFCAPEGGDAGAGGAGGGGSGGGAAGAGGDAGAGGAGGSTTGGGDTGGGTGGQAAAPQGGGGKGGHGSKVVPMARDTLAKLARENQDRGKKAAHAEFEKRAKALGYDSADEMFKAAEQGKRRQGGAQQHRNGDQRRGGNNGRQDDRRNQRRDDRQTRGDQRPQQQRGNGRQQQQQPAGDDEGTRALRERVDRERRQRINAERRAEEARREAFAAEATGELRVMALRVGIKDSDYAIELMTREMNSERNKLAMKHSGDDLEREFGKYVDQFDEQKFFEGLKTSRPYLFQETVVPATTGTSQPGDGAPPPGAGKVTNQQINDRKVDASKMKPHEYHAELRRRGLKVPST